MTAFPSRRRRSTWTEVPDADATYWRVTCQLCGFTDTKSSRRNVQLCIIGHHGHNHFGHPRDYSVVPLKREEAGRE